jgi:hypothetical protein
MYKGASYKDYARSAINHIGKVESIQSRLKDHANMLRNLSISNPAKIHDINNTLAILDNYILPQYANPDHILSNGPEVLKRSSNLIHELADYLYQNSGSLSKKAMKYKVAYITGVK